MKESRNHWAQNGKWKQAEEKPDCDTRSLASARQRIDAAVLLPSRQLNERRFRRGWPCQAWASTCERAVPGCATPCCGGDRSVRVSRYVGQSPGTPSMGTRGEALGLERKWRIIHWASERHFHQSHAGSAQHARSQSINHQVVMSEARAPPNVERVRFKSPPPHGHDHCPWLVEVQCSAANKNNL